VRVASDGDDAGRGGGATAIPQSVDDSIFTAQVGALELFLPIRLASDGDNEWSGGSAGSAGGSQTTTESVGTAQIGSVDADLPVRVASDGDNEAAAAAGSAGGSQTTTESILTAQIGSVDADLPVRVASDGDNEAATAAGSAGESQTTTESILTAQIGSVDANLPVRVASDGDNESTGSAGSAGGSQTTTDSIGTVQIGSGQAGAPGGGLAETVTPLAEVASIPSGVPAGQEVTALGGEHTDSGGDSPGTTVPALDRLADPEPTELVAAVAQPADSPMASSQDGTLPFTGAGLAILLVGLAFAASGFALRLTAGYRVPVA
jgi:hypothetical protein